MVEINKKEERREHVAVRRKRKKIEVEKNKPLYIMFVIKRDELMDAQDEVRELERLLNEAWLRRRNLLKKKINARMVGLGIGIYWILTSN